MPDGVFAQKQRFIPVTLSRGHRRRKPLSSLRPAQCIPPRLDLYFGGPGVLTMLAEEFSLETAERRENSGNRAPGKMAAELGVFDPGRPALRASNGLAQNPRSRVPIIQQALGAGVISFIDPKANSSQCFGGQKEKALQRSFIIHLRGDASLLQAFADGFGLFRLVEGCNSHGFHRILFYLPYYTTYPATRILSRR